MVEIRPMTPDEMLDVAKVHVRSWQHAYAGILPADYLDALDPAVWTARPGYGHDGALVAVVDGQIAGLAFFGPYRPDEGEDSGPGVGELRAIYVDPEHWRGGIGAKLMAAAKDGLAAEGFTSLRLWVLEQNHRARQFYERQGLRADGVREMWVPRGTSLELPELRYATAL